MERGAAGSAVVVAPASTNRRYSLLRRESLSSGDWVGVEGQTDVAGQGGEQAFQDPTPAPQAFYTVKVRVGP